MQEKQEQLKEYSGEEVLRGDDFKKYINKLRGKSTAYKTKKSELNDLRAEYGILSRTEEILKSQDATIEEQLVSSYYYLEIKQELSALHTLVKNHNIFKNFVTRTSIKVQIALQGFNKF